VTTAHTHACALCRADFSCEYDCDAGRQRLSEWCPDCTFGVDGLAEQALRPHWVSLVGIVLTVRRATRRAVESSRGGVDAFSQFCADLELLEPADADREDCDTWARIGAVQGARDGWLNRPAKVAPDVPQHDGVRECYSAGWCLASMIVGLTKMEMTKC
jgi:hypothetical protein